MIKIASLTFDIYDDVSGNIAKTLPAEFHMIKVAAHESMNELHDHQFALVMKTASGLRRRYPLNTPDAVKLSEAYFNAVKDSMHPALVKVAETKFADPDSNIVAYCDVTDLEPQIQKVAFTQHVFGLTIEGRECFPLHDVTLTETAVSRFPGTMIDLDPAERFQYARNISKQASALNVEIPLDSPIHLYTANELNTHSLQHAIWQRKEAAGHRQSTEVLDQLESAARCTLKQGEMETEASFKYRNKIASLQKQLSVDKIIGVLINFDKLAGFTSQQYLHGMLDPFAACFKTAGYESNNMMVDGIDLSKLNPDRMNEKFDPEFMNEFNQNPVQVYQSSPDPVKSMIREMTASIPTACCSTAVGSGEPSDQLNPTLSNPIKA